MAASNWVRGRRHNSTPRPPPPPAAPPLGRPAVELHPPLLPPVPRPHVQLAVVQPDLAAAVPPPGHLLARQVRQHGLPGPVRPLPRPAVPPPRMDQPRVRR